MKVSVIVPSYNDDLRLQLCLDALGSQDLPFGNYEVVVVNNSLDPVRIVLPGPNFRVVQETKPGSYAARNLGVNCSVGEILAFTDSDCIPDKQWISKGIAAICEPGIDRVAGNVAVFPRATKMTPVECYEKIFAFDQESNVKNGVSVTANLFVLRRVFDEVGFFNSNLLSGGDTEWNKRATDRGLSLKYADDVIVNHPARNSWLELSRKVRRTTGGKYSIDSKYDLSFFRSLCPPIAAARHIFSTNENFRTKFLALYIAYKIKLEKLNAIRKLRSGCSAPERS